MLIVKNISKTYKTGELVQKALNDVSLTLRDNEFVSVLGPSGSGKTTLLNVIGGLDRYEGGDLIINDVSTKEYKDRDWDSYRNHTIGFVFQSYNLIPHQSILSNVELALTISGISRSERRKRARQALEDVGLGDQLHKRPNQMSGGQMQRVAIARALVNNPEIFLADEPTGALDTQTSVQVMELLKQVAKHRLVVMVTHNSELAEQYATRIIKLKDGVIVADSDPYTPDTTKQKQPGHKNMGKAKMSFMTSLSLSFNNLKSKMGRTVLTSFAGSIGIIGIALIIALSTGVNTYIADIQKDTMKSYPITISAKAIDMSTMMGIRGEMIGQMDSSSTRDETTDGIYGDTTEIELNKSFESSITENNLTAFKKYIDNPDSEINDYIGDNGIVCSYNVSFNAYSYDKDGELVRTDADPEEVVGKSNTGFGFSSDTGGMGMIGSIISGRDSSSESAENFEQLISGTDYKVSSVLSDSYDVVYGDWPDTYDEVVLVLDEYGSIPVDSMYQLGLITADEYKDIYDSIKGAEPDKKLRWDYDELCDHEFYMLPACDEYIKNDNGTFSFVGDDSEYTDELLNDSLKLRISGVIRAKKDNVNASLNAAVAYSPRLTDYLIRHTDESAVVKAQQESPKINVLTSVAFDAADDSSRIADAKDYLKKLNDSDKATVYAMIMYEQQKKSDDSEEQPTDTSAMQGYGASIYSSASAGTPTGSDAMAKALDNWLDNSPDDEILLDIYERYLSDASFDGNMKDFGRVSYDAPSAISIYTDSFEAKDAVSRCIIDYNKTVSEDDRITYTDYVAMLTSSLTSIVDVVSYILIAFVGVSLVVSCIMIGIITYISVIERTKEIGILRALGASKRNISQVFNAETIIIGLCSGFIGVAVSALLTIPLNMLIATLVGAGTVTAYLPVSAAVVLVIISVLITVIGGLIPAKKAAKKDPVEALRTE